MTKVDKQFVVRAIRDLLIGIGEDPDREGLARTPTRVAEFWSEFIDRDHGVLDRTFSRIHEGQIVYVAGIREWSMCEHHMLPMLLEITVGYQTDCKILGLSKLVRVVRKHCSGLSIQEKIAYGIMSEIGEITGTKHVGVFVRGIHLCMMMRGVHSNAVAVTSSTSGCFHSERFSTRLEQVARDARNPIWPS